MPKKIVPLNIPPGIQKDGTRFACKQWRDGKWVRFQNGRPRKMGGYSLVQIGDAPNGLTSSPSAIFVFPLSDENRPNSFIVYVGMFDSVKQTIVTIDENNKVVQREPFFDITPMTTPPLPTPPRPDFPVDIKSLWTFDVATEPKTGKATLLAHIAPNLGDINSSKNGYFFSMPILDGERLRRFSIKDPENQDVRVSGGFFILYPFLILFGSNGEIVISKENDWTKSDEIIYKTNNKIVAARQTRGGEYSPSGLLWSTDSLIKMSFTGELEEPKTPFQFDTISDDISILSSRSIIEYDGLFFWAATNRFLLYNGIVQEIPQNPSINFFFENLNFKQRQKVWGTKIPHYGEIWWFFPKIGSDECNHALIFNVREKCWYDTPLPEARVIGFYSQTFLSPLWVEPPSGTVVGAEAKIWQHEYGHDELRGTAATAIESFIETGDFSFIVQEGQPGLDRAIELERVEPDFIQEKMMTLSVKTRAYSRSPYKEKTFDFDPNTEKIDMREHGRIISLRFISNVVGGHFMLGQTMMTLNIGDGRP